MLDDAVHAVLAAYPTIHAACRRRYQREPRTGGRLSQHIMNLLEQLDVSEPLTVGELATRMRVTPATVSLQLTRLTRLRLVARARDDADARRVQVRLTEAGARLREQGSLLDPARVRAALGRLPAQEQDTVVAGVRLLARAAHGLPGEPPNGTAAATPGRGSPDR